MSEEEFDVCVSCGKVTSYKKTDNILFMCGGAFEGLKDILSKRVMVGNSTIGFAKSIENSSELDQDKLFAMANSDDLLNYGFIPE